jgi:hypothetical protein
MEQLPSILDSLCIDHGFLSSDRVLLVQEFIKPFQDQVYRVWFLDGKVTCAVKRKFSSDLALNQSQDGWMTQNSDQESNAFSRGCAGSDGSCLLDEMDYTSNKPVTSGSQGNEPESMPWVVSKNVCAEIENLLTLIKGLHTGSVEFLCNENEDHRVYFDLNMLSTLPTDNNEEWTNLAQSMLQFALRSKARGEYSNATD